MLREPGTLHKLQLAQNVAARFLMKRRRQEHIWFILKMYWLPVKYHTGFEIALLVCKVLHSPSLSLTVFVLTVLVNLCDLLSSKSPLKTKDFNFLLTISYRENIKIVPDFCCSPDSENFTEPTEQSLWFAVGRTVKYLVELISQYHIVFSSFATHRVREESGFRLSES